MIVYVRDKVLLPQYFIPKFEAAFPGSPIYRLEKASHFLLEDGPERITDITDIFIRKTSDRG